MTQKRFGGLRRAFVFVSGRIFPLTGEAFFKTAKQEL
jgi:hypothetical protein